MYVCILSEFPFVWMKTWWKEEFEKNEMSNVLEKQNDVRNFRSWYYDNLGLRGVEQRKALDLLLKDDEIGKYMVPEKYFVAWNTNQWSHVKYNTTCGRTLHVHS